MKFTTRATIVALALAGTPATSAARVNAAPRGSCSKTFTIHMFSRAAHSAYRGTRVPTKGDLAHLRRFLRCAKHPWAKPVDRRIWVRVRSRNAARRNPPMQTMIASVYDAAGGPIACGGNSYAMGVANRTLPCGTRLRVCYAGCVDAVVFDRGPFIAGRDIDLSRAVQGAIGFPFGVGPVRVHIY